ncbi:hypothetical protein HDU76_000866 [Blyttiomyces sp. JEL0837]|nr:hypothetical protein HDU76_000866 [Blyttiomyces sp. JEL0837]
MAVLGDELDSDGELESDRIGTVDQESDKGGGDDDHVANVEGVDDTRRLYYGNQHPALPSNSELKPIIVDYFWKGYHNKEIVDLLDDDHGIRLSDQVARILKELDPEGTEKRKKQVLQRRIYYAVGPDDQWCSDGHDKFLPFGLGIHGCVDAWSGKWIWLRVFVTNHDPRVVGLYYLQAIKERRVFPFTTRTDCGTETVLMASMQMVLHDLHETGVMTDQNHKFVTSTRNQKIESGWSRFLRAKGLALKLEIERGYERLANFNENDQLDKFVFWYVFMPLTQRILDDYVRERNTSRRRKQKNSILPHAPPDVCYAIPEKYGGAFCGTAADMSVIDVLIESYCSDPIVTEYLPADVKAGADLIYKTIGSPKITLSTAWDLVIAIRDGLVNLAK